MSIHRDVGGAVGEARRLDVADRAQRGYSGNVRGKIAPALPAVARELNHTVVCTRPDLTLRDRRFGDRKHDVGVFDADVVWRESTRDRLLRLVVACEIGADRGPAVPTIGGSVHELAADVHRVVIVRRDREREGPLKAILDAIGWRSRRRLRPYLDGADAGGPHIILRDDPADGAASRCARPDEILVDGIGCRPSAFAATYRPPLPAANAHVFAEELLLRIAGPHRRLAVLLVAIHEVRHSVVDGHVIHLRDR